MTSPAGARRTARLAVLLLGIAHLTSLTLWCQTGDGARFLDCEARVAAHPDGWTSFCFVEIASEHQLWGEAQRRVRAHLRSRPDDPYLRFVLGSLELDGGSVAGAAQQYRAAAEAFAARGESDGEARAWVNVSECRMRQGLLDEMDRALERAAVAARDAGDPDLLASVRVRQTRLLRRQGGDLEAADRTLLQLERELPADAHYQTWRDLLYERAVVLHRLGRYGEARRINERWAELARSAGKLRDEATALVEIALDVAAQSPRAGVREEAIRRMRRALEAAQTVGNRSAEIPAHRELGKLLGGDDGRRHLEECLRLTTSADEPLLQSACLFALAGSLASEDPGRAQGLVDEALTLALASEDPWTLAYGWAERLRVSWATRSRSEAAAESLAVLDHIETLRRLQTSESGRAAFFTDWVAVYHSLAGFLLDGPDGPSRDELETTFSISERLRARVLLDSLAAARVDPPAPPDPILAEKRTEVLGEIVRVQRTLQSPSLGEAERSEHLAELDGLERDLADLDARLGIATALPEVGFVGLSEVEAELSPQEAVLAFLEAPDEDVYGKFAGGSWLLAVTSTGTRVYRLPGAMELQTKVQTFVGLVEGRDDAVLGLGAATLYDDLLGAALAELPARVEELILVPDGVLHLLPFGLLRPHPQADPLATKYRLSLAPSVTLWYRWRQGGEGSAAVAPRAALALADPAFVGSSPGAGGPNDTLAATLSDKAASEDRQWALETGGRLGRLPYAANEGRAVVRRLGGPPSRVRIGEEASEAFLKSAPLGEFGVLHFAAHALVDAERPRRSAVLLAAGGPDEDGLLQPREIAALDLTGKLVVVSACESGSGQLLLGEGVQSLARAFFRAGARAVVASLWRLEDDEAAAFFGLFYRALGGGDSVAGAVAEARRGLRRRGAPAAAWAGVVVLGDGDMVPVPGGVSRFGRGWLLLGLLPVAAALLWALRRAQRRRRLLPG